MLQRGCTFILLLTAVALTAGCTRGPEKSEPDKQDNQPAAKAKHDSWWCVEHGLPEAECWACSAKYERERKVKGDWCAKHERPESECFLCHPESKAKFAGQYEAKYGKKPPEPEDY
jgi:cobalt-zinc-cadmium efflux system membrane fusion protein